MFSPAFIQRSSRPLRFLVSGGLATSVHWALMGILLTYSTNASTATAAGSATGAAANYLLQRRFTFQSRISHRETVPLYVVAVMVSWVANLLIFTVLYGGAWLPVAQAQGVTSLLVAFINFWLFKRFVFS